MLNPWIRLGWPANNSETRLITPGVSILSFVSFEFLGCGAVSDARLALEVFHDVKKSVVHVRLFRELNFNLI